jgi:hypothetical protein
MSYIIPRSKYGNVKTKIGAHKFDSKMESEFYLYLLKQKACGKIKHIELQPKVYLTLSRILIKPDFKIVMPDDSYYFVDIKGMVTPVFAIKFRLWKNYGDGRLDIIKLQRKEWVVVESAIAVSADSIPK